MITLGLRLDFNEIRHSLSDSLFVSFVKLIVAPVVMFLMEYYPLACFIFLSALWNISCEINASDLNEEI